MPKTIRFLDILLSHGSWSFKILKALDYTLGGFLAFVLPSQKPSLLKKALNKILIIRPGGIGDAVFLLPLLTALKAKGLSIDILCETRNKEVFLSQGYPVYLYDHLNSLRQVMRISYDMLIDTEQWHYSSAVLGYFLKAQYKVGFATRPWRGKLFHNQVVYDQKAYELNNFKKLFEGMSLPSMNLEHSFVVPKTVQKWASIQVPANSVSIFLGASIPLRRLSKKLSLDLIENTLSKKQHPVLLGGRDVEGVAQEIMKKLDSQQVSNFVGQCSLLESAALIQRGERFVGPDSGLMHLACAVGTSVEAVFGPGDLQKWYPLGRSHQVISTHASCSPCTRFGYTVPTCHGTHHCMKDIHVGLFKKG
jgi:ADP-heptose:LPS heptosyltransferase